MHRKGIRRSHLGLKPRKVATTGIIVKVRPSTTFNKPVLAVSRHNRRQIRKQRTESKRDTAPFGFALFKKLFGR